MTKEDLLREHDKYAWECDESEHVVPYSAAEKSMDEYAKQREQYWKDRCLAAEDFISATPCDPDITNEQVLAGEKWQSLKDQEDLFIEQQNKP